MLSSLRDEEENESYEPPHQQGESVSDELVHYYLSQLASYSAPAPSETFPHVFKGIISFPHNEHVGVRANGDW